MARRSFMLPAVVCLSCLCTLLTVFASATFQDEKFFDASFLSIGRGLACDLAKCLRGQCVNTALFPFYKCECNAGWQSPFGASWLPCILPNCSIDLSCSNKSVVTPAPSLVVPSFGGGFDVCSLHVCGNGECIHNRSSARNTTDDYECACDSGYVNFGSKADGYCIHKCSVGADCTKVKLPFGRAGSGPPPSAVASPMSSSSSRSVNQGTSPTPSGTPSTSHFITAGSRLLAVTTSVLLFFQSRHTFSCNFALPY